MRLGLVLPFSGDAPGAVRTAQRAQELGFDGIFATDHLFVPGRPDAPTLDPFTLLSAIAVACPGLHVGTLVARVTDRAELNNLIAQMISELSALHASVRGGDARDGQDNITVASLGAASGFLGKVGKDPLSRMVFSTVRDMGVAWLTTIPAAGVIAIIVLQIWKGVAAL